MPDMMTTEYQKTMPEGWDLCAYPQPGESISFGFEKELPGDVCLIIWRGHNDRFGYCIDRGETRLKRTETIFLTPLEAALICEENVPKVLADIP